MIGAEARAQSQPADTGTQKSLLIISFHYAPTSGPRVFRWQPIAEAWAARGYHVDVLSEQPDNAPDYEVINGVHVHRVKAPMPRDVFNSVFARRAAPAQSETPLSRPPSERASRKVERVYRAVRKRIVKAAGKVTLRLLKWAWKNFAWPDNRGLWIIPATKKARMLVSARSYDVVISVSMRVTSHFVALRLHRPDRRWMWILDIGDPFSFHVMAPPNNLALYNRLNRWSDRKLLRCADAIAVTTPRTGKRYAELAPESRDKITVIPPLFSAPTPVTEQRVVFPQDDRIRLVFTGALKRINRRPETMIEIFKQLRKMPGGDRFELHFAGLLDKCESAFADILPEINRTVYVHGVVSRHVAVQMIHEADILVNIGYLGDYQLPSKLVDYVSTGKPIVNVATIADDTSAEFLRSYPAALLLTVNDKASIARAAEQIYNLIGSMPPPVSAAVIDEILAPHRKEAIVRAYDVLIEQRQKQRAPTFNR